MSPDPRRRLAVVLSHPIQYYSPWFRWLQAHTALELKVFYLWDFGVTARHDPQFGATIRWDVDLLSGYESEFVPNLARRPGTSHLGGLRNPQLGRRLASWRPDLILIFGYKWRSHLQTIAWARWRRIPLVFRGDSHFLGRPLPARPRLLLLRWLFRQFAAVTYVGAANRAYFERLGVPPQRLFFAPHSVDGALFNADDSGHHRAAQALRARLGLGPEIRVALFAGKLVPPKQPRELLQAFLDLAPSQAALVFVGEGEEKPALESLARSAVPGTVHFLPFANQSEMPARYLSADFFVLPSRGPYETWGLAVNEAMQMGRPCLVSDQVGCQQDLVSDGETGWVFRADRPGALRDRLRAAFAADLRPFRPAVLGRIARYSYQSSTAGLLAAIQSLDPAAA